MKVDQPTVVLASNLRMLLDWARDHQKPFADAKALGKKAGVTGTTIGRWMKGSHAAQIDKLQQVAEVFGLEAWQLLIPNLDPSNPPAVPYTDAERRLYWRIKAAARELALGSAVDDEDEVGGDGIGRDSSDQGAAKRQREIKK